MKETALTILRDVFGYEHFRPHQKEIIEQVISGRDVLVLMPTGGGKSLCYQIPALVRPGTGLVISPLIALMQDQVQGLRQLGVRTAYLNSTLQPSEAQQVERCLRAGDLDLLYIAPERLLTPRTLELLDHSPLGLFAIDEVHCVSQWGHDFRPEYLQLSVLRERYPAIPRIALTATADQPTREDIVRRLQLEQAQTFMTGFDRPNIRYRIVQKNNARNQLLSFLRSEHWGDSGIVYCMSRKKVDRISAWLNDQGLTALPYHAGLDKLVRQRHQQRFLQEDRVIVVATIAFGMGIDKPDVRFVAHLDLPKSIEAYYQETGRAGRDGLAADAWMTYGLQDVIALRQMLESSEADAAHKRIERHKLEAMLGLCESNTCRRQMLLRHFGENSSTPCGNCDNCLQPPETWEGTEAAQKALSCVYRTGQRFGVNYVIDVLLGKDEPRIRRFGHHRLSTFGIGSELTTSEWRVVFRQLIVRDILMVDMQGYGALRLTANSRPILRGERNLQFRRERKPVRVRPYDSSVSAHANPADQKLWEALRARRRQLAEQQGVPPYIIFHDRTLMKMAEQRPKDLQQFSRISGVGEKKLERYGEIFLQVIREQDTQMEPIIGDRS